MYMFRKVAIYMCDKNCNVGFMFIKKNNIAIDIKIIIFVVILFDLLYTLFSVLYILLCYSGFICLNLFYI